MRLSNHIIASGLTSMAFGAVTKSWPGALVCFFSGILIDSDHFWEFYIHKKRWCFNLTELERFCQHGKVDRFYLILHSYELLLVLWAAISLFHLPVVWVGLVFGMTVHLIFDQFTNPIWPLAYFWFYRRSLGFPPWMFMKLKEEPVNY